MNDINDEGVVAVLGLVLMTQPNQEVRISDWAVVKGLPDNSGVQVFQDQQTGELVVRIAPVGE